MQPPMQPPMQPSMQPPLQQPITQLTTYCLNSPIFESGSQEESLLERYIDWLDRRYPKFINDFENAKTALLREVYNLELLKKETDEDLKDIVNKRGIWKYIFLHIKEFIHEQRDSEGSA
jgi:hypothetical protein